MTFLISSKLKRCRGQGRLEKKLRELTLITVIVPNYYTAIHHPCMKSTCESSCKETSSELLDKIQKGTPRFNNIQQTLLKTGNSRKKTSFQGMSWRLYRSEVTVSAGAFRLLSFSPVHAHKCRPDLSFDRATCRTRHRRCTGEGEGAATELPVEFSAGIDWTAPSLRHENKNSRRKCNRDRIYFRENFAAEKNIYPENRFSGACVAVFSDSWIHFYNFRHAYFL